MSGDFGIAAQAPEHIRAISPYPPGKPITALAREMGIPVDSIVKLASNENPLGMSPKARAAAQAALDALSRYPDQHDLLHAIAERHGLGMDRVILGNGSNDVLECAARAFLAPGRSSVYSRHAFAVYPLASMAAGAECIEVSARKEDFGHDLAAMLLAVRHDTRIVWIANPNNPTGTFLPHRELKVFLDALPQRVLVVLDEAYNEYLPPALAGDSLPWLEQYPNLLVTRTFSKVHGLAGLRVGYGLGSAQVIDLLNRVRQPFNVNNVALAAAQAAFDDHRFVAESFDLNRRGLEQIVAGLKHLGLGHIPAHGNFVAFRVADAAAVNQRLLKKGVIVRPLANYAMPDHLRVTVGLERENARFLEALEQSL